MFYSIITEFGILETKYRAFELEKYYVALNLHMSKITQQITLREVCRKFNTRIVEVCKASIHCKCSGRCFKDKRFIFFKNKNIFSIKFIQIRSSFLKNDLRK